MAAAIGRRQMAGDAAGCLLHPREPTYVRNHARDNVRAIREKENVIKSQKILLNQAPPSEPFKLKRFMQAKPRVHDLRLQRLPGSGGRMQSEPPIRRKGSPPCETIEQQEEEMDLASFEAAVEDLKRKHGKGEPSLALIRKDANGCPSYLRKIKDELALEEQQIKAQLVRASPDAPAGYRRLPADEVAEKLAALRSEREEIEKEFRALPLAIQTDAQKRREKAVKAKIEGSDRALKIYSAPDVFVPV